jgi:hypothetical protein
VVEVARRISVIPNNPVSAATAGFGPPFWSRCNSVDILLGIGQIVIGVTVVYVALQQHALSKRQEAVDQLWFKHELYERRSSVYRATLKFIAHVVQESSMDVVTLSEFYRDTAECDFLFGLEIRNYIDHLYSAGNSLQATHEQSRKTQTLLFFGNQLRDARIKFSPYLKLYDKEMTWASK